MSKGHLTEAKLPAAWVPQGLGWGAAMHYLWFLTPTSSRVILYMVAGLVCKRPCCRVEHESLVPLQ